MKITKIKKLNSGKYKVDFDNGDKLTTYDDVILNNNLLFNKELDDDDFKKINNDNNYYDVYSKIIKMISTKLRSSSEITNYMNKNNVSESFQKKIMKQLKDNGFINDENFCKAFISDRIYLSNDGPYKIKKQLKDYKISDDLIDKYIYEIDNEQILNKLEKLIIKKINCNHNSSKNILKQKILSGFIDMGYSKDMIIDCFDKNYKDNNVILKEYEKVKNKLSKKYSSNELEYKIKEKLYQKGFSFDEINSIKK